MDRADLSSARYEAREFGETPRNLRKESQELPEPHPNLTREEAVVFRQLQTEHMVTPVMGKHIMPEVYKDDSCKLRRSTRATLYHIAWDCTRRPTEASREKCLPPEIKTAIQAEDYDQQIQVCPQDPSASQEAGSCRTASRRRKDDVKPRLLVQSSTSGTIKMFSNQPTNRDPASGL
ncbi:hypothetical protein HPB47_017499 [Ixodes persulcatus]|uniref:Uncharacterized protein n=1 Tax=Ixodes persulcatus TaxID=34615 RepID=A0AC60QN53_IXOPE|nr:hypothetical protein HPB47_017499 [Ixodes persulcatus]